MEDAKVEAPNKNEAKPKKKSVSEAKKNLLARVLTSRRSLFHDARALMESQPKVHGTRAKLQLGFGVVFMAVHHQNLKRQVCQIFMQAGYERAQREALKKGLRPPKMRFPQAPQTIEKTEAPKEKYSIKLAGTLRAIMEARAWMNRAQERKKAANEQGSVVSNIANQTEKLQGTLGDDLDGFNEVKHQIEDQLAVAHALEAKLCCNQEQRQQQREMDHPGCEVSKGAAAAAGAKAQDALRNMAAEGQKRAHEEERRCSQAVTDLYKRLVEDDGDQAARAVKLGAAVEDVAKVCWDKQKSDGSDATVKNWADNVLGACPDKCSTLCPAVPACEDKTPAAVDGGGSRTAAENATVATQRLATGWSRLPLPSRSSGSDRTAQAEDGQTVAGTPAVAEPQAATGALGIVDANTSSHAPQFVAASGFAAEGRHSKVTGIATDSTSSGTIPATADGMSSGACTTTTCGAGLRGACAPLQQRPQQTWHKKRESAEEEASLDGVSTHADLHADTTESDSASDDVSRSSQVHDSNFNIFVATVADSSATGSKSSIYHYEGPGMQEHPEFEVIRWKAQRSLLTGVDNGSLEALLAKACALAESDDGHLHIHPQGTAAPRETGSSRRRRQHEFDEHHRCSEASRGAGRPSRRHLQCPGWSPTPQEHCEYVSPAAAAADVAHRAVSKPLYSDEANVGKLDLPEPPSSRAVSKLSHHGVDSLSEMAEGDWQIRTVSRNQGIEVPGVLELRPNTAGSSFEPGCGSLTARPSSMAESRSQPRASKGFPNAARWAMEAKMPAEIMKAEDLTHRMLSKPSSAKMTTEESSPAFGQDDAENVEAAMTTHRLLSKPSSARAAMEAGRRKDMLSPSPAPPLLTVRRLNSKTRRDSVAAAAAYETLEKRFEPLATEESVSRSQNRRRSTGSNFLSLKGLDQITAGTDKNLSRISGADHFLSPRGLDQMTVGPDRSSSRNLGLDQMTVGTEKSPSRNSRRPSKQALHKRASTGSADFDAFRQRQSSKSSNPRRSSKSSNDCPTVKLNVAGQRVLQPEVLVSCSSSKN